VRRKIRAQQGKLSRVLRTDSIRAAAWRLFFFSRCAHEKNLGHSRGSKKQDNGTAEVSTRKKKKFNTQQGKYLKK